MNIMKTILLFTAAFCLSMINGIAQSPGTLNASFGTGGYQFLDIGGKDQFGSAVAVQPNGKVLIGGIHEHTTNKYDFLVYRLNPDGSLDNTFHNDGKYTESFNDNDRLIDIAVSPTGKILLCGHTQTPNNGFNIIIQQLNADGSLDNTFGTNGIVELDRSTGEDDIAAGMIVAPNGKIYVGGAMSILGEVYFLVHRLNSDGSPDNSFSQDGNNFKKMGTAGNVHDCALAPDGSFVLGGWVKENNVNKMAVLKFNNNGFFDNTFAGDGMKVFQPGWNIESSISGITILPNGVIMCAGTQEDNNAVDGVIVQLTAGGVMDASFSGVGSQTYDLSLGGTDGLYKIESLANGKFLLLGYTHLNSVRKAKLIQINNDGSIDQANYGGGTGKLDVTISPGSEYVYGLTVNNGYAFTMGHYSNGNHTDVFVSSSYLHNPIGLNEQSLISSNMNIFPNPATSSQAIAIELDPEIKGMVNISLLSITGEEIVNDSFYKASEVYKHQFELNGASPGIYLVKIENEDRVGVQKLIVR
jgi:uncharacterized delta-60 repeat protein